MKYIEDSCRVCGRTLTFAPSYCELHFAKYDPKKYVRLLAFIKYGQNRCRQCQDCKRVGDVEIHHPDYTKPYEFISLCKRCHIEAEKRRDKSFDDKLSEYWYNQIVNSYVPLKKGVK